MRTDTRRDAMDDRLAHTLVRRVERQAYRERAAAHLLAFGPGSGWRSSAGLDRSLAGADAARAARWRAPASLELAS